MWPRDRNSAAATVRLSRGSSSIGAPLLLLLCALQEVQTDVQMKFFIELLNGDRTHPNTCHRCNLPYLRVPGTASTDCILPRFSPLFVHNTKTKLEFYRHQSCTPQQGVKALVCWATGKRLTNSVIRLSLGRRLVNLLPVAQQTNAFTNGVVGRTAGAGRRTNEVFY